MFTTSQAVIFNQFDQSQLSGRADHSQQTGLLRRGALQQHDTKQDILKDAVVGFAEIKSVIIVNTKMDDMGSLKCVISSLPLLVHS